MIRPHVAAWLATFACLCCFATAVPVGPSGYNPAAFAADPLPPIPPGPTPTPTPDPKPTPAPAEFIVRLEGPQVPVTSGGFSVVVTAPSDARLYWKNSFPALAAAPLEMETKAGQTVYVFLNPVAGDYKFYLRAQKPVDGMDPLAEAELLVTVGGPAPKPPVTPKPAPKPAPKPSVVAPTAALQTLLGPVKAAVAKGTKPQAVAWGLAWADWQKAYTVGPPLDTMGKFKAATQEYANKAAAAIPLPPQCFPGYSAALETAWQGYFGPNDDGALDPLKAQDWLKGLVWVCQ